MPTCLAALVLALACGAAPAGDYPANRRTAVALADSGQLAEALAAFLNLAETAGSDVQRSDALDQAARCAARLKQDEQALELAGKIPLAPVQRTCRMRLLTDRRLFREVVDQYGADDFGTWPEYLAAEAHQLRGGAYRNLRDGERAAADLEQATRLLTEGNTLGLAYAALGDVYRDQLHDDDRALAAYRQVYRTPNFYKHCAAAIAVAELYRRRTQPADALAELDRLPFDQLAVPFWRASVLAAKAAALVDLGRPTEALTCYQQALQQPDLHPSQRAAYAQAADALR